MSQPRNCSRLTGHPADWHPWTSTRAWSRRSSTCSAPGPPRRRSVRRTPRGPWVTRTGATLMERARQAARRLVADQRVVITQGGEVVDPATATGPIRIRRA